MKFLVVNDTQFTGKQPVSRKDNIVETLARKAKEIRDIANANEVKAILHTGDFWDSPLPSLNIAAIYINAWTGANLSFNEDEELDEISFESMGTEQRPTYGIIGNHDIFHKNIATVGRSMLGFMNRLGLYNFLEKEKAVFFEENGCKVAVTGSHYNALIDTAKRDDYIVDEKQGDIHIHLVHGSLTDKDYGRLYEHTPIKEISHTKADITLCGHEHVGFGVVELDGKVFANTGSTFRMTAERNDMERRPSVLLIEIDEKTKAVSTEIVYLKSARPWKEVLDRKRLDEAKAKARALEEIAEGLGTAGEYVGSTAFEIIEEIAAKENLPDVVKNRLLARLEKSAEILDGSYASQVDISGIEIDVEEV